MNFECPSEALFFKLNPGELVRKPIQERPGARLTWALLRHVQMSFWLLSNLTTTILTSYALLFFYTPPTISPVPTCSTLLLKLLLSDHHSSLAVGRPFCFFFFVALRFRSTSFTQLIALGLTLAISFIITLVTTPHWPHLYQRGQRTPNGKRNRSGPFQFRKSSPFATLHSAPV